MELWPFPHPRIKNRETVKRIRTEMAEQSRRVRMKKEELAVLEVALQERKINLQRLMQIRNER